MSPKRHRKKSSAQVSSAAVQRTVLTLQPTTALIGHLDLFYLFLNLIQMESQDTFLGSGFSLNMSETVTRLLPIVGVFFHCSIGFPFV